MSGDDAGRRTRRDYGRDGNPRPPRAKQGRDPGAPPEWNAVPPADLPPAWDRAEPAPRPAPRLPLPGRQAPPVQRAPRPAEPAARPATRSDPAPRPMPAAEPPLAARPRPAEPTPAPRRPSDDRDDGFTREAPLAAPAAREPAPPRGRGAGGGGNGGRAGRGSGGVPPRRPPRRSHGAAWILALVVVAAGLVWFGARAVRDRGGDGASGDAATATTASPVIGRVTFPEGLRREDIAQILKDRTPISPKEYLELTAAGPRGRRLSGASGPRSLEGFLFPATYDLTKGMTAKQMVDAQLQAYANNAGGVDYSYARSKNLTRFDVLIIASLVEREVRVPAERQLVAGVMYNRLKSGMRLDIDATVQYAVGSWKTELTQSDLNSDSPYNTRKFKGLPPGPICNPGLESINAAAHPKGDYLFYVARNDGTGRHYFARTDAEFQAAIARSRANAGG